MESTEENMEELGDIYLQEVSNIYESKREKCTSEEKRKIDMLNLGFHKSVPSLKYRKYCMLLNIHDRF